VLDVTAGASGAPNGFTMYWMTQTDYDDYGDVWPSTISYPTLHWANFTDAPTLNTGDGAYTTFKLAPFQTIRIEIGDLADESGLSTNSPEELDYGPTWGTDYEVCAYAIGGAQGTRSTFSLNAAGATTLVQNCTFTIGYWKNNTGPGAWPVTSLTLGTVVYNQAQLISILNQPTGGNGLVSLAHQLIPAKLNIYNGAVPTPLVSATIAAADAQIGALVIPPVGGGSLTPGSTAAKTQILDDFNNGITGPGHCNDTPTKHSTWGSVKSLYR
jgi:hypothetical protein